MANPNYSLTFASLPNPKRTWHFPANSHEESLGKLALLTPELVARVAAAEIRTGRRVGLSWDITKLEYGQFSRMKCGHSIIPLMLGKDGEWSGCFDDVYHFNPQTSSQWDGFRHYSQPRDTASPSSSNDRLFYGGTTREEIMDKDCHRIGTQAWATEGIAGRGILLDYADWASKHGISYSTFSTHSISFSTIKAMLEFYKLSPQKGDILFIRTGVMPEWDAMNEAQKIAYAASDKPEHAGVEACLETLEWLWDEGFAAVAGDAISWEVFPTPGEISMHEYLLAGWGVPIGELFDLEALAKTCHELGRYTFFITSMPLNMPGGVSSPPNAMAIF